MIDFPLKDFTDYVSNSLLPEKIVKEFQEHIREFYVFYGRPFDWRETITPYRVVVSEIMLQQTQTERVKKKFDQFIKSCASFQELAEASSREVLTLWQGLGYNRRGLALHMIAKKVVDEYQGVLPQDPDVLVKFPGIGKATASSICAFAFNKPTVFIETNIRAVYIHLFFRDRDNVTDKELMPLIEQTLVHDDARHWYYALMDYGVMLKKRFKNPSRRSKHHVKQAKFEGSERQIRGMILRALTQHEYLSYKDLCSIIARDSQRIKKNLSVLCSESMVKKLSNDTYDL